MPITHKLRTRITALSARLPLHNNRDHKTKQTLSHHAIRHLPNFCFAIIKLVVGVFLWSLWFVIFGGYGLMLLLIRSYFLWRLQQVHTANASFSERQRTEMTYLREGGLLYALVGVLLVGLSTYMYFNSQPHYYNRSIAILIACIGFTKMITATIGWFKA